MSIFPRTLTFVTPLADFCRCNPAFLYGVASLIGAAAALQPLPMLPSIILLLAVVLLAGCMKIQKESLQRLMLALCLAAGAFMLTAVRHHYPASLPKGEGDAVVSLNSVALAKTPFGKVWNYNATLRSYNYKGAALTKNLPLKLSIPYDPLKQRPQADSTYIISAALKQSSKGTYYLSPSKQSAWDPVRQDWGLAEWRYASKASFQESIHRSVRDPHVAAFLAGMVTGAFDDQVLSFELGRFGLQHLMAVSGLHFSILSSIIGGLCCLFLSRKGAAWAVIVIMTAYFIFLGSSPSVVRAWITLLLALTALTLERRSTGLNALGIGLMAIVFWDPHLIKEIGFQFSFGVTAAILLWYAPCDSWLRSLFPKRALQEAASMDMWDRHGYCLLYFLRQGLALGIAVNLAALPLTLYHFHKFPLISLLYNLFFPPLVSVSLFLAAAAAGIGPVFPWLASWIHSLNEAYTSFLLNFAFNLPRSLDLSWQVASFPLDLLLLYLLALLLAGMSLQKKYLLEQDHFV